MLSKLLIEIEIEDKTIQYQLLDVQIEILEIERMKLTDDIVQLQHNLEIE